MKFPFAFSLVGSPNEVIAFCNEIRKNAATNHLRFDLSEVSELTMDGVAVFISTLKEDEIRHTTKIQGNVPADSSVRAVLESSGFYRLVQTQTPLGSKAKGKIVSVPQNSGRKYNQEVAAGLIDHARSYAAFAPIQLKRCFHALEELMENTVQHASKEGRGREPWWTSLFFDEARGVACFTFNDNGVGVFKSLRFNQIMTLYTGSPFTDAGDRLRKVLSGEVRSSTKLPWRGEGLPAVRLDCDRGILNRLIVITNDAYADVSSQDYRALSANFKGTFFYWEISSQPEPAGST
jgi:hypothetical protein